MKTLTVSAQVLGHSFARDPELRIPQQPRFIREVLTIPYGADGLLFEGVRDVQVIAGRSARSFLPRLLPLLDGTRSFADLAAVFPALPPQAIHDALALLYSRGLLEDGPLDTAPGRNTALAAYAGRYADVTRVNRSRGEVLDRLAARKVAVVATDAAADLMAAMADQGLHSLTVLDDPAQLTAGAFDLLVGVFTGDVGHPREWFAAAWAAGIRALHVHVGADKVELGPYFIPGTSGCHDCFRALEPVAPQGTAHDAGFWTGVAALQAFNLLSRLGPVKLYNVCRVHRRTDAGPVYEKRNLARLPGCPACGLDGAGPAPDHPDTRAWVLHNAAHVMTAKELRSPRDHQIHYAASNLELTEKPPAPRHGAVAIALPPVGPAADQALAPVWSAPPMPRDRLDLALLAELLHHAAGYQEGPYGRRRIAPSGGGLASADLFVIVRKLPGLEPGAYHYFGWGHRLERITVVPDEALAGALGIMVHDLPPVLILGTSDLRKTRQKYDEFSFRIGTLDGGVARQYLQDLADAAGVDTVEYPDTRDALLSLLLHIPEAGNRRMHCFAIGLGKPHLPGERPDGLLNHYQSTDALIAMCGRLGPSRPGPDAPLPAPRVAPHAVQPLTTLMQRRRSHRLFAPRPLPAAVLHSLAALGHDAALRRDRSSGLSLPMSLWLLVERASDLAPGIYRWDPGSGSLAVQRPGLERSDLIGIMQQHGYADAPLTCVVTGDFGDALTRYGPRGYRELSSRAGSMLARMQLAGLSWDVVGSMWGGVAEEAAGQLLGIDRYRQCPLFAASFGYASDG